jgi:hypothetical protein
VTTTELATLALADIRSHPKSTVFASRKGIVAATVSLKVGSCVAFRRVDGKIFLEVSKTQGNARPTVYGLTDDLQARAAEILDNL